MLGAKEVNGARFQTETLPNSVNDGGLGRSPRPCDEQRGCGKLQGEIAKAERHAAPIRASALAAVLSAIVTQAP
jgi:hypothetical protein